jgi:hypothetical protein
LFSDPSLDIDSLHYHLREFHKTNMFKADYKELFGMDGQGSAGSPPRHNRGVLSSQPGGHDAKELAGKAPMVTV